MPSARAPKVFISATTGDLGSVRTLVTKALLQIGCMPVEQADFPPDYRSVAGFLASEIKGCDALIHLVGHRYGEEPNPETRPPGTVPRSYTQLEYDCAQKLGKKVYVFLCAPGFPYDPCEPESPRKTLLQEAHRATIAEGDAKYEAVADPTQCTDKVKLLRLQLEELAQQIAAEHRRQMIAWSTTVGVLCLLLIASAAVLVGLGRVRDDSRQITRDTRQLIRRTGALQRTGEAVHQEVSQTLEVQKQTTSRVVSIDVKVRALLESDTLAAIAEKSDVEPQQIKQLVLQSQSAGVDTLSYARRLASEGRHDAALGLARFVGETALLLETSNYRAAAEAFLIAARAQAALAVQAKSRADRMRQFAQAEALALRGLDAVRTLKPAEQEGCEDLFVDLAVERAHGLNYEMNNADPSDARALITKAVAQIDEALRRQPDDVARQYLLHRRRAFYLAAKTSWVSFREAETLLAEALAEADRSLALAHDLNDVEAQTIALLTRVRAREQLHTLQPHRLAAETLQRLREDCQAALALPAVDGSGPARREIAARMGLAALELSQLASDSQEELALLAAAEDELTRALQEAESRGAGYSAARIAAMGLLRAHALQGHRRESELAFESANAYGFSSKEDIFAWADFAIHRANEAQPGCLSQIDDAIERVRELQLSHSAAFAPRTFAQAGFVLARCELARSGIVRGEDFGDRAQDRLDALRALELLSKQFSRAEAPRVWAEARYRTGLWCRTRLFLQGTYGSPEDAIAAFSDALSVFTPEDEPLRWVVAKSRLADALAEVDPPRLDDALAALADLRLVFDRERSPALFAAFCSRFGMLHQQRAERIDDPTKKRAALNEALRYRVLAHQTALTRLEEPYRYFRELDALIQVIKEPLSEAERSEVDEEVERLKQEAAKQ